MRFPTALSLLLLAATAPATVAVPARGPLRVNPDNPRYFTDGTKNADGKFRAIYLTGSHTWPNLIDRGPRDPPPEFNFAWYLDLLEKHHHNFIRLWGRQVLWYHDYGDDGVLYAAPLAWGRTGPGDALDGKPKFDLSRLDPAYFERLRARVAAARDRGIYVGIMLFGGSYECRGGWQGNPFHAANNVNGINGDPNGDGAGLESHTLDLPPITKIQEAYVRKVIETVNDLDNVLFEISNEGPGSSRQWQYHLVDVIHSHEKTLPKRHPVGMTALYDGDNANNDALRSSDAEWISTNEIPANVVAGLPPADGKKVSLLDSDHWFIFQIVGDEKFGRDWVWKNFCRGHNTLLMENFPVDSGVDVPVTTEEPGHVASRKAMGITRRLADRVDFVAMTPRPDLASTKHCLAAEGRDYIVYLPEGGTATLDLSKAAGGFEIRWIDPIGGESTGPTRISGGTVRELNPPGPGPAVAHVKAAGEWVQLFNGKDLTGWTPKITGRELGDNWRDTFRVEGGVLKVAYDQYPEFGGHFGHLFYKDKFSHYRLRVEYRFIGQQTPGGPGWAVRNSGVMLHCQDPQTMTRDQEFPVSIEVQFLGGDGKADRTTANLCTPGTHVEVDGQLVTRHCTNSTSKTYQGDQWVTVEVEVRGGEAVRHLIDGKVVLEYQKPQLDENDKDAQSLLAKGTPKLVGEGYISLQAESHPVEFRKVELMQLPE